MFLMKLVFIAYRGRKMMKDKAMKASNLRILRDNRVQY